MATQQQQLTPEQIARATVEYQKQKDVLALLNDEFDDIESSLSKIASDAIKFAKTNKDSNRQISELKGIYNSLSKTARTLSSYTEDYSNGVLKTKDVSKVLRDITRDEDRIQRQITSAKKAGNVGLAYRLQKELEILDKEKKSAETLKEQNELIDKQVGVTGKLLSGLEKIPILGDAVDFEEINTSMRQAAGHSNVFAAGLKTATSQLKEGLKDPLIQFALLVGFYKKIFDLAKEHDEMLTKGGRQLAINKDQAQELYKRYSNYASSVHDSFVTGKRLYESQVALNTALGTFVDYGEKSADAFARLTHFYDLSEEEASKLEELGRIQGKDASHILNVTLKTAAEQKKQFGGAISYQNVLKKVSGISGDVLTRFKGSTEALVEAVMQADRLGLTLEQVDKVGESLLNFESSIENELKAELLTGKALNMEKARSAALSGSTVELMKEIKTQVGDIHKFEKLNTIQRQAYAEAFGMTASEMGDMLRKQQFEAQLGDKVKASAEEQLKYAKENNIEMSDAIKQSLEQRSLAEEQKEIFDKLRDVIRKITSGPMLQFFHLIEAALKKVLSLVELFGKMTGGALGSALGAALVGLPAAIAIFRLGSSLFIPKPTGRPTDPIATYSVGGPGGFVGKLSPTAQAAAQIKAANPGMTSAVALAKARSQANWGKGFTAGNYSLAAGLGLGMAGMALGSTASGMQPGGAKTAVGALGGAATGAGIGMMFGPYGAIIGGLIGGIGSLVSGLQEDREARKAKEKSAAEYETKRLQLLEDLSMRPVKIDIGTDTIMKTVINQNQYGPSDAA